MALFLPGAKAFPGIWKGKGAEMIREDLEAAGVLSRDDRGALVTTDECGFVYDFHDLRHTFGTLLNKAKVPLATAQRLMRHSDPKLTANIYTHVLIDDKAEALANLPTIAARRPADEQAAKTGTEDAPAFLQVGNWMDTPRDTSALDLDGEIWTCTESPEGRKAPLSGMAGNVKTPCLPMGNKGRICGANSGIRTQDLRFANEQPQNCNILNRKKLHELQNSLDTPRDTLASKNAITIAETTRSAIPSELVNIVASWTSIPDQIKAAVQAVLAPYLIGGDRKEGDG